VYASELMNSEIEIPAADAVNETHMGCSNVVDVFLAKHKVILSKCLYINNRRLLER